MTRREPDTPDWQPFSIKRLLRMVGGLVFVDETHELGEADDGEPIIARAERRLDEMLAARREARPADYDPIDDDDSLIADIAVIMIRYKELTRLERETDPRARSSLHGASLEQKGRQNGGQWFGRRLW
jgi:hypothetical protein